MYLKITPAARTLSPAVWAVQQLVGKKHAALESFVLNFLCVDTMPDLWEAEAVHVSSFRQMPWPSQSLDSACDWFVSKALVVWGDIDLVSPHQEPWSFHKGEISPWILSWWMIHSSPRAIMDTEDRIPNLVTWDFWRHWRLVVGGFFTLKFARLEAILLPLLLTTHCNSSWGATGHCCGMWGKSSSIGGKAPTQNIAVSCFNVDLYTCALGYLYGFYGRCGYGQGMINIV